MPEIQVAGNNQAGGITGKGIFGRGMKPQIRFATTDKQAKGGAEPGRQED